MTPSFTYAAKVERVVDADTIDVALDLGMRVHLRTRLRVAHIDAPELSTPEGKAARTFVVDLLPVGAPVVVATRKPDKYGRALADVAFAIGDQALDVDLAGLLVVAGHARGNYEGGAR